MCLLWHIEAIFPNLAFNILAFFKGNIIYFSFPRARNSHLMDLSIKTKIK